MPGHINGYLVAGKSHYELNYNDGKVVLIVKILLRYAQIIEIVESLALVF